MNILKHGSLFLIVASSSLQAQPAGQQAAQMQQDAMQQMVAMQECMSKIDMQELAGMEQRSAAFETEIKSLCAQGNEAQAKTRALVFSEEVMSSKTMQAMKECAAMVPAMAQQMEVPDFKQELEQKSICAIINEK